MALIRTVDRGLIMSIKPIKGWQVEVRSTKKIKKPILETTFIEISYKYKIIITAFILKQPASKNRFDSRETFCRHKNIQSSQKSLKRSSDRDEIVTIEANWKELRLVAAEQGEAVLEQCDTWSLWPVSAQGYFPSVKSQLSLLNSQAWQ